MQSPARDGSECPIKTLESKNWTGLGKMGIQERSSAQKHYKKTWTGKILRKKLVKVTPSALLVKLDGDYMRDGTYRGVATKPGETTRRTLIREDSESELYVRTEIDGESKDHPSCAKENKRKKMLSNSYLECTIR